MTNDPLLRLQVIEASAMEVIKTLARTTSGPGEGTLVLASVASYMLDTQTDDKHEAFNDFCELVKGMISFPEVVS